MPSRADRRLEDAFQRVRSFVALKHPSLERISLDTRCWNVKDDRNRPGVDGARSFMHVGHQTNTICTWGLASGELPISHLVGLFLHEFGHLASRGGELKADAWALVEFGIPITYRGRLCLEWVDPDLIREKGI